MLLFIAVTLGMTTRCLNFNTSHVTVYHNLLSVYYSANHHFNTSHVTVYHRLVGGFKSFLRISIHLMLLFIARQKNRSIKQLLISIHLMLLFINICRFKRLLNLSISIHLMLLFINALALSTTGNPLFQYISCYCLSISLSFVTLDFANFNTSHVTVYRKYDGEDVIQQGYFNTSHVTVYHFEYRVAEINFKFQYISCYCLSNSSCSYCSAISLFQYISCYCLSLFSAGCMILLFLFQYISCYCLSGWKLWELGR